MKHTSGANARLVGGFEITMSTPNGRCSDLAQENAMAGPSPKSRSRCNAIQIHDPPSSTELRSLRKKGRGQDVHNADV